MAEKEKKVKKEHCKACGGRGVEPDGPKCLECNKEESPKKGK